MISEHGLPKGSSDQKDGKTRNDFGHRLFSLKYTRHRADTTIYYSKTSVCCQGKSPERILGYENMSLV